MAPDVLFVLDLFQRLELSSLLNERYNQPHPPRALVRYTFSGSRKVTNTTSPIDAGPETILTV